MKWYMEAAVYYGGLGITGLQKVAFVADVFCSVVLFIRSKINVDVMALA